MSERREDCQICCVEFEEDDLVRTTCPSGSHRFCRECYEEWCHSQTTQSCSERGDVVCPMCQHRLPFTGLVTILNHRGIKVAEKNYVDGEICGLQRYWDDEGRIVFERHILHGKRHGMGRDWWPSGHLQFEGLFVHDNFEGWVRYWDQEGNLLRETFWCNGSPQTVEIPIS